MSVRRLPSGSFQARLTIDGAQHASTFTTEEEAHDWVVVMRARSITGRLPKRITVREYAARWMATYDTAPSSTQAWHQGNVDRYIIPALGRRLIADITPTEISRMLNDIRESVSAAKADAVYRTADRMSEHQIVDHDRQPQMPSWDELGMIQRSLLQEALRGPHLVLDQPPHHRPGRRSSRARGEPDPGRSHRTPRHPGPHRRLRPPPRPPQPHGVDRRGCCGRRDHDPTDARTQVRVR